MLKGIMLFFSTRSTLVGYFGGERGNGGNVSDSFWLPNLLPALSESKPFAERLRLKKSHP